MKGGTIRTVESSSLDVVGCHVTFWACPCFEFWPTIVFCFNGFDDFSELGGHCLLVLVGGISQDKESLVMLWIAIVVSYLVRVFWGGPVLSSSSLLGSKLGAA